MLGSKCPTFRTIHSPYVTLQIEVIHDCINKRCFVLEKERINRCIDVITYTALSLFGNNVPQILDC